MNCKLGDLVVYVGHQPQFLGHIKTVVRFAGYHPWNGRPGWYVEPPFIGGYGDPHIAYDECLRPIRPGGITDEEVRELYSPKQTEVA